MEINNPKKYKPTKKVMMFYTNTWQRILIVIGMAISTSSIYPCNVQAQSLGEKGNILIAQNLGGIVRKIPLEEVPLTTMSAAKTVTNAQFNQARIELKSDGSLIYIMRGKNQQGFQVEAQVTPSGTIIQVDEQIDTSAVPEIAVKAFKRWAPNDQIISIWRSTRLGELYYQFVIQDFWLEVATDGNKVMIYRKKVNIT
ncbi:hypothetical protein OGM63_18000 [Plectonema radiosum NIES-515]|uniref:PepSY domain-containing protein n=1 Tax=Plectonema radiosum NIES-515 TaxID=2986073 RepID=A0ABT3B1Z5_9CYAN|nr:hypothetical protein [Plectonema radiosum]MCV3215383.1 hypothetical protein [Plectonema radiosum NIES-515]